MNDDIVKRVLDLANAVQQIPAPTFEEAERAEFVRGRFLAEGLNNVEIDAVGNVLARLPGANPQARALIVSAHLDTVFPRETDLRLEHIAGRIHAPGIGDNSLGVAALFGLVWSLRQRGASLPMDVWFAANTGEEGLGDLRGMKAIVNRFGAQVIGYLVVEGASLGHVYHRAIAVQRYRISIDTSGGHAWSDFGKPSAIHELAALAARIAALPVPVLPRTTLNVGRIEGGTSINTLAAHAWLELDMRSELPQALTNLVQRVDALIAAASRPGVRVEAKGIGSRPGGSIPSDHPLVQLALACSRAQGLDPILIGGSTDANVPLSRAIPAVVMGVTTGGRAHTVDEFIDVEPVERGLAALVEFVEQAGRV